MGKSLNTIIMIKNIVKNILGIINCHINGITKYGRNIYNTSVNFYRKIKS